MRSGERTISIAPPVPSRTCTTTGLVETKYIYTNDDSTGKELNGQNVYTITFRCAAGEGVLVTHLVQRGEFFPPGYSLGTKNRSLKFNADGSLTPDSPSKLPAWGQGKQLATRAGRDRSRSTFAPTGLTRPSLTVHGSRRPSRWRSKYIASLRASRHHDRTTTTADCATDDDGRQHTDDGHASVERVRDGDGQVLSFEATGRRYSAPPAQGYRTPSSRAFAGHHARDLPATDCEVPARSDTIPAGC